MTFVKLSSHEDRKLLRAFKKKSVSVDASSVGMRTAAANHVQLLPVLQAEAIRISTLLFVSERWNKKIRNICRLMLQKFEWWDIWVSDDDQIHSKEDFAALMHSRKFLRFSPNMLY